ncbi:MAG: sigma-70 family RNA polymerase sigma factor [Bacteroidetes bacterium]|nr:sigma-70 family RNA polymerase sigma factor [Bacteroidota bacterium]MCH8523775.1 sigma-70 family RNA polymerase sigma factor [Balneolales bacterium]
METSRTHNQDFRRAIEERNKAQIDEYVTDMVPRLTEYLVITFGANLNVARECVQQAFVAVLERIAARAMADDTNITAYLMIVSRNEYFAYLKNEHRSGSAVFQEMFYTEPAEQLQALMDEDRQRILELCLQTLDGRSRELIAYMFKRPEASLLKVSKVFGISPVNVRTRKSRIINKLADCYQKKSNE